MNKKELFERERYYNADMMNIHIANLELNNKLMETLNIRRISTGRVASSWCLPLFELLEKNKWRVHMYLGLKENEEGEKVYCDRYCYITDDETVRKFLQSESLGKAYNQYLKRNDEAVVEPAMEKHLPLNEGKTRKMLAREAKNMKMVENLNQL